ncbi:MAG: arsenical pump membrane protein [Promethearchaeota archaeon CR_4]|nr:MAG: arsenical pump membrane protein [Candidatus Lokiarchaeota archaeon CR_4]
MLISAIIVVSCFAGVVLLILTGKMNRAIAAITGAIICYFVLIYIEKDVVVDFSTFIGFLFGTIEDGFVSLHSILLILGMMLVVNVCHEAGVFQFLAFRLVQLTKGRPKYMLVVLCSITVLVSAVLNNILTVIILIPLTIMISRILNVNPEPYILMEAILVNIGGTIFTISSIPNILITSSAGISFGEFFLNVGVLSLFVFGITIAFFFLLYRKKLTYNPDSAWVLQEYNALNFVPNVSLLYKSIGVLVGVLVCFILIPSTLIPPDIIALTAGIILVIISRLNPKEIIKKLDFELILYLLGIFVIAGSLEATGFIELIGTGLGALGGDSAYANIMIILWVSAYLSANIDNIPITRVLIPVVGVIGQKFSPDIQRLANYALAIGANWGDNLTPMGDNILVVNLCEQNKRPISVREFTKLGFITTNLQLLVITIIYSLVMATLIGFIILGTLAVIIGLVLWRRKKRQKVK